MSLSTVATVPVLGWCAAPVLASIKALPFYVLWQLFNIKKFFLFLPEAYLAAGFWDIVGLFLVLSFMKEIVTPNLNRPSLSESFDKIFKKK